MTRVFFAALAPRYLRSYGGFFLDNGQGSLRSHAIVIAFGKGGTILALKPSDRHIEQFGIDTRLLARCKRHGLEAKRSRPDTAS